MAVGSKHLECVTLSAASAMSAASAQFCFVKLTATGTVHPTTANTDQPLGVLQDSPGLGEMAKVAVKGITKLRVNGTDIAVGAKVGADSTGRAIALTAGTSPAFYVAGSVLYVDATDNDGALVTALIDCYNPPRNA